MSAARLKADTSHLIILQQRARLHRDWLNKQRRNQADRGRSSAFSLLAASQPPSTSARPTFCCFFCLFVLPFANVLETLRCNYMPPYTLLTKRFLHHHPRFFFSLRTSPVTSLLRQLTNIIRRAYPRRALTRCCPPTRSIHSKYQKSSLRDWLVYRMIYRSGLTFTPPSHRITLAAYGTT